MTGLNPEKEVILEIATIITDDSLEIVAEGPNISINYPEEILETMDEWNRTHHKESGLLDRVNTSPYDCQMAEKETLKFISRHCKKGESLLCGNSIWQDRRYRMIDVSSIKELVKRWYPSLPPYEKKKDHLALSDIKESISELKYYRQKIFRPGLPD
jgi:oligoribonuclease